VRKERDASMQQTKPGNKEIRAAGDFSAHFPFWIRISEDIPTRTLFMHSGFGGHYRQYLPGQVNPGSTISGFRIMSS